MKKTIIIAAALVAMTACNKNLIEVSSVDGFGYINLGVSADTELVVTKAETLDAAASADYTITLTGSQKNWTKKFSEIADDDKKMPAGTYTMTAQNISDDAAVAGNGAMLLIGENNNVVVEAGKATDVEITCAIANSKVTVNFDPEFTNVFDIEAEPVVLDPLGRAVAMTPGDHAAEGTEAAWFNDGTTVNWTLSVVVESTSQPKTYNGSFAVTAGTWNQLTFKAGKNGSISLVIKVDESIVEVPVEEIIDPLS